MGRRPSSATFAELSLPERPAMYENERPFGPPVPRERLVGSVDPSSP